MGFPMGIPIWDGNGNDFKPMGIPTCGFCVFCGFSRGFSWGHAACLISGRDESKCLISGTGQKRYLISGTGRVKMPNFRDGTGEDT